MPSLLSQTISRAFHTRSSRQQQPQPQHHVSSVYDGRLSIDSDCSTLINVELPMASPLKATAVLPKYANERTNNVQEDDMIDPEDQAWGPPPPMKWSMPKRRSSKNTTSSRRS